MTKQEIEARIGAINYILGNELYDEDMYQEILDDLQELNAMLNEPMNSQEDAKESSEVESILKQRGSQYGDYADFVDNMTEIMNILDRPVGLTDIMKYRVEDIENFFFVLKLLRLQTAKDLDSITDLIGYATLSKERRENDRHYS